MSKITDFTWEEFWDMQEKYEDMLCDIEDRIIEIARSLGEVYQPHNLSDIHFEHDEFNEYVVAEMRMDELDENGEEKYEYYKVNVKWLFSDDYKKEIDEKEAKRKQKEADEYREYLRLKEKFEGKR